jgi:hypothetical protein
MRSQVFGWKHFPLTSEYYWTKESKLGKVYLSTNELSMMQPRNHQELRAFGVRVVIAAWAS